MLAYLIMTGICIYITIWYITTNYKYKFDELGKYDNEPIINNKVLGKISVFCLCCIPLIRLLILTAMVYVITLPIDEISKLADDLKEMRDKENNR